MMNELQQGDLLRGAEIARDEYGLDRLHENVVDAVTAIRHKDDLINLLLDKIELLEKKRERIAA